MLYSFWKWAPLPIIAILAKKYCQRFVICGKVYAQPFKGVLIEIDDNKVK